LLISLPIFLLGAVDDRFDIPARLRIILQLSIGLAIVYLFEIRIDLLDGIFSDSPRVLGPVLAGIFTVVCSCGVFNAINMADGIDGLLGSVASISLTAVGLLALLAGVYPEAYLSFTVLGLLLGYLSFNLGFFGHMRRVFLGDSGSMLLGLVLLILLVALSQKSEPVITPTSAGWLLGLPLLDTVSVMVRRIAQGRSPFAAGRDHFHHVLQDLGLSRSNTLYALVVIQCLFVTVGVFANLSDLPQYVFFWGFVVVTLIQFFGLNAIAKFSAKATITETGLVKN